MNALSTRFLTPIALLALWGCSSAEMSAAHYQQDCGRENTELLGVLDADGDPAAPEFDVEALETLAVGEWQGALTGAQLAETTTVDLQVVADGDVMVTWFQDNDPFLVDVCQPFSELPLRVTLTDGALGLSLDVALTLEVVGTELNLGTASTEVAADDLGQLGLGLQQDLLLNMDFVHGSDDDGADRRVFGTFTSFDAQNPETVAEFSAYPVELP